MFNLCIIINVVPDASFYQSNQKPSMLRIFGGKWRTSKKVSQVIFEVHVQATSGCLIDHLCMTAAAR